jgi:hypothetical protein
MAKLIITRIIQLAGIIILISAAFMLGSIGIGLADSFGMGYDRSAAVTNGDISTETAVTTLGSISTFVAIIFGAACAALVIILSIFFIRGIIRDIPVYRKYFKVGEKNEKN